MHRFQTKYANRKKDDRKSVKAVGAVEKTGVRATYKLHDKMLSNPTARKSFKEQVPELDGDQHDVVEMLNEDGLAVVPFTKLFDEELWSDLAASSRAFADQIEADLQSEDEPIVIERSDDVEGGDQGSSQGRKGQGPQGREGRSGPQQAELPSAVVPDGDRLRPTIPGSSSPRRLGCSM